MADGSAHSRGQSDEDDSSGETTPADVSLGGETAKGTAAKFVTLAVGSVGSIVLARFLGPAAYGGFYALLAVVEIVDRPVRGWASAGKKRASEAGADRDEIATALVGVLGVFLLVASFGAVVAGDLLRSYAELSAAVAMFVVLLVSTTLYVTIRALVEARGFVGLAMWTNTARNATAVPLQIVLAIPLGLGFGAAGMAYGYALGTLLVVPVVAYYARVWITTPSVETLRSLWSYAKYSIPNGFVGKVYSRFDLILLGVLVGPAAVANYEIAFRISMPATFISITAASVLMAKVSHSATSGGSIKSEVVSTLSYASLLSIPIFFGAVVIADDLVVALYGGAYAEAGLFLVGLAFYRILRSQTSPLKNVVNGLNRPDYNLRLSTVVLVINIGLGIAFVFEIGAIGIVIATVIAEAIRYLGLIWFLRQSNPGISLFPRPLQAQIGAGFLMCLFVFTFVETAPFDRTLTTGFAVFSGALAYAAFLLAGSQYHRRLARSGVDRLL